MPNTTSREEIAANVRAAVARARVEQSAIADLLGKSRPAVSDRMHGRTHFRVDELQAIAAFLEVPLEQLLAPASEEASA
jgi:transcriptional regulator with XRE-family HTH domain